MHFFFGAIAALAAVGLARVVRSGHPALGGTLEGERLERIRQSPQHDGKTFVNPVPTSTGVQMSALAMLRRWWFGEEVRVPAAPLPVYSLDPRALTTLPASGLRVTWMGHASALIEIDGARVLTDPVFGKRVSPVAAVGPARFLPAPVPLERLPRLDAVVVSHDHYDHLDHQTIVALAATGTTFVVPLGVGAHLARWGVDEARIVELDWWQRAAVAGIEFVATPARHFSGRSVRDRNQTLWASFALRGPRHRVYFGGDSGMFPGFAEIGEREGPFDLTLLPIGAYNEAWLAVHMNPEEAVAAHASLRGGVFVPIHWATFNLAFHDWFEPAERLLEAARAAHVPLAMPLAGQPIEPAALPPLDTWWRAATPDAAANAGAANAASRAPR